jgi:hypothetical protein
VEKRCCSSEQCLQPEITTENLTCPFVCQNGGIYDQQHRLCRCPKERYGLCCERETPFCGEILLKNSGEMTSLDFPNYYPNNAKCIWKITAAPNRRIALGVKNKKFDVEPGSNIYSCNYDYVIVYDGLSYQDKCLGRFCGSLLFNKGFRTVYSSGNNMLIEFSSDYIVRRKGFHLQYSVFFSSQECGPYSIYTRTKGTITSPHYPIPYKPRQDCQWTIDVKEGNDVILSFENMDLISAPDCQYGDYLEVIGIRGNAMKSVKAFCGGNIPEPFTVTASSEGFQKLKIRFKSDYSMEGMGFVLKFTQVQPQTTGSDDENDNGSV